MNQDDDELHNHQADGDGEALHSANGRRLVRSNNHDSDNGRNGGVITGADAGTDNDNMDYEYVDEEKKKEIAFRKKRFRLLSACHRYNDQQKQRRRSGGGIGGGDGSNSPGADLSPTPSPRSFMSTGSQRSTMLFQRCSLLDTLLFYTSSCPYPTRN